ncbi:MULTISPECIES: hypothetical protein [Clostridium]|uniref:Uncharacterized protein n=1 Tax=Clostridium carnis TaxID=1530 RepID=A0ABY6SRI4_9CLOT|nr:hypothetical protein [Clostridium carnis]CAI3543036.1 hypothetical protein CNEO3_1060014 [Clostridium neonatale]CAI3561549.1 hypothetical protein CNEO3_120046 [Clostridium neonatale]CAI3562852.1 hypothetical protein CNEO3_110053 [Clostridium neonatale]CAI3583795.1 hypothetical protein CNEO3_150051 [Clostridium neonatale]CAI3623525.1 hypothetical protein CNEO3_420046 [Clostridium neonatale]
MEEKDKQKETALEGAVQEQYSENKEYSIEITEELTEEDLKTETSEEIKKLFRFFIEHNQEKKVIKIHSTNDNCITLHGKSDAENFIQLIQDYIQTMFGTQQ